MMEKTLFVGKELIDALGKKWKVVDEHAWNINIELFDQNERGLACRYIATVDLLAYRMQIAEDRKLPGQNRYYNGFVPKLSPDHLRALTRFFEGEIYHNLVNSGITTDTEYKELMDVEKPKDVNGCSRYYIENYSVMDDVEKVKGEIRKRGPVYGNFEMRNTSFILQFDNGYYRNFGDPETVDDWAKTVYGEDELEKLVELAKGPLHHAVSIIGFGRCVNEEDNLEEEYYVFVDPDGRKVGRMSQDCLDYAVAPILPD